MNHFIAKNYSIQADRPLIGLAPMRGYDDLPFRQICEDMGADFSTIAINIDEFDDTPPALHFTQKRPRVVQLLGSDIKKMAQTAKYYGDTGVDIVDINLGRPARGDSQGGSLLLNDLNKLRELLTAVVQACPVPVTLKTRLGINSDNLTAMEIAKIACDLGIQLITIHGRTKEEGFSGMAQFDDIKTIKSAFPNVAILANGDITTPDKAKQIIEATACDGVLIGRGAIGEPWLFSALRATLDYDFVVPQIDLSATVLNHIRNIHRDNNHTKAGRALAKKHIGHYLMGFGLEKQIMVFDDNDGEIEHIQKLSALFPNIEDDEESRDENNSPVLAEDTGRRSKKQIKNELFILYDEYHNVSAKFSGAKLERKLHTIVDEMEKRQLELREHSLLSRLKRLFKI